MHPVVPVCRYSVYINQVRNGDVDGTVSYKVQYVFHIPSSLSRSSLSLLSSSSSKGIQFSSKLYL